MVTLVIYDAALVPQMQLHELRRIFCNCSGRPIQLKYFLAQAIMRMYLDSDRAIAERVRAVAVENAILL